MTSSASSSSSSPGSLDDTLAALADPTRRAVVDLLRQGSLRAGDLATALQATPASMSRHLKVLRQAGVVELDDDATDDNGDARVRVYRLRRGPLAGLRAWLEDVEALWQDQLEAFAAQAERTGKAPTKGAKKGRR